MENFYATIFFIGVIYTVVTFLLGSIFDFFHVGGEVLNHISVSLHSDSAGIDNTGTGITVSPLKPIVIVSFLTVFGGVGMICTNSKLNAIITFIIAFLFAYLVAAILYKFVVVPLYKAQNTSSIAQEEIIGMKGIVISPILEEGFGQISYTVNGSRQTAPARHINGKAVSQGQDVIIREIRDNVFYVDVINEEKISIEERNEI